MTMTMTTMLNKPGFRFVLRRIFALSEYSISANANMLPKSLPRCCGCQIPPVTLRCISTSAVLRKRRKTAPDPAAAPEDKFKKKPQAAVVPIWKNMTVQDLANSLDKSLDHVFEAMIYVPQADVYDSPGSSIDDLKIIREIVKKCGLRSIVTGPPVNPGHESQDTVVSVEHLELHPRPVSKADLAPRDPVVTIMGHVDHGKTTLLDSLRKSNIASGEAGGITQHIGAFRVPVNGRFITFLDTPGHAAFSALRNRGAQATDIVILVVAADDGVMEQTRESISMAKEANVPIIVAINKIDKANADVERTKTTLMQEGIQLEDSGGDIQSVSISALKGTNIPELMDAIFLQAEMMNLQSEIRGRVEGVVLESRIDHGRGKLSTGLVQRGMLRKSSILVAGTAWAKVRGIFDEHGNILQEAGPSTPVEIIGWRELPSAGDKIYEVDSEKRAREIIQYRENLKMHEKQQEDAEAISIKTTEYLKDYKPFLEEKRRLGRYRYRKRGPRPKETQEDTDPTPKIHLLVKADVDGSIESLLDVLDTYDAHNQCRVDVVHYGVGDLTENDIKLAETFGAHIYGFNVSLPDKLEPELQKAGLVFRESKVIYRLVEYLIKDIEEILPPKDVEEEIGTANVLAQFTITDGKKKIPVAGARCTKGMLRKDAIFKLLRGSENEVVYNGKVSSIRHLKNEVDSIKNGVECGIALSNSSVEPEPGDTIMCYKMVQVAQKSEWDPGF